jgi:hypothetical protein
MKSRYDKAPGKEAANANVRQKRMEAMHSEADSFVKSQERKVEAKAGHNPVLKAENLEFCSYMSNNGMHAQDLARELTKGLDKDAFPVK